MSGDIVALGDGQVGGNIQKFDLQVGQTVVYSKFGIGSTDLDIQGERHTMLREDDCIGIMPKSNATASDIPELKPVGDRVLIKASSSHCRWAILLLQDMMLELLHCTVLAHFNSQQQNVHTTCKQGRGISVALSGRLLCTTGARGDSCNSWWTYAARECA